MSLSVISTLVTLLTEILITCLGPETSALTQLAPTRTPSSYNICDDVCECDRFLIKCVDINTLTSLTSLMTADGKLKISKINVQNQNNVTEVTGDTLRPFLNLQHLILKKCSISSISIDTFVHSKKLRAIDLSMNLIKRVSWKVFMQRELLPGLTQVLLDNNPLVCNCGIKWIQLELLKKQNGKVAGDPICKEDEVTNDVINLKLDDCDLPVVVSSPLLVDGNEDDDVTLKCVSKSRPRSIIKWDTRHIHSSFKVYEFESNLTDDGSSLDSSLVISNVTGADNGWLTCSAENIVGRVSSKIKVQINCRPLIQELAIKATFHLCINYIVIGHPQPNRIWLYNNKRLSLTSSKTLSSSNSKSESYTMRDVVGTDKTGKVYGCLEIKNPTQANNGIYTLVASNEYGTVNRSVHLEVDKEIKVPPVSRFVPFSDKSDGSNDVNDDNGSTNIGIMESSNFLAVTISIVVALILLIFIGIVGVLYWKRRKKKANRKASTDNYSVGYSISRNGYRTDDNRLLQSRSIDSQRLLLNPVYSQNILVNTNNVLRHINREKVNFIQTLGEGAFGKVFLATVDYLTPEDPTTMVAVKTLKDIDYEDMKKDFYREAELIMNLIHPNIVTLFGISDDHGPPMMIFEYMEHGDLNSFLRSRCPDSPYLIPNDHQGREQETLNTQQLLTIAMHISAGMEYLSSQHFVHRDLATRNCLVGEHLTVKIGDFGMSRDVYSSDYYRVGGHTMLPVRWMPPECILYRKFTVESDIWSYGVVLWEIFEFGKQPWFELSNHEVIQEVTSGRLLPKPRQCPEDIYRVMTDCWQKVPSSRIQMKSINETIKVYFNSSPLYLELTP
ncbi:NTRK2 (predicted) [Pycnogonum litorale]